MHEADSTEITADLIKQLIQAMDRKSEEHAAVTVRPRLPSWIVSIFVGLVLALAAMFVTGLVTWGSIQNRVTNLENAHPESLSSLASEVHSMNLQLQEITRRFNDMVDEQSKRSK